MMAKKYIRVDVPRNTDKMIELAENILAKYNENPSSSPLTVLDMADFENLSDEAKALCNEVKQLRRDAETATEDRNTKLGIRKDQNSNTPRTVINFIQKAKTILMGVHKGEEQHLGDYGFGVSQTARGNKTESEDGEEKA